MFEKNLVHALKTAALFAAPKSDIRALHFIRLHTAGNRTHVYASNGHDLFMESLLDAPDTLREPLYIPADAVKKLKTCPLSALPAVPVGREIVEKWACLDRTAEAVQPASVAFPPSGVDVPLQSFGLVMKALASYKRAEIPLMQVVGLSNCYAWLFSSGERLFNWSTVRILCMCRNADDFKGE